MDKQQILYEDKDIIVCHKPAGIATQTARLGQRDMISEVANYLAAASAADGKLNKPPYVGLIHRLDQPVEGILVFAKNQRAAGELGRQITANQMEKYYYAVAALSRDNNGVDTPNKTSTINEPNVPNETNAVYITDARSKIIDKEGANVPNELDEITLINYLCKDGRSNVSTVVTKEQNGAKRAELRYKIVERIPSISNLESFGDMDLALMRIKLITGRHHQIRVQMSNAGMSLLGDYKYADSKTRKLSELTGQKQVALCAYELIFSHPITDKRMSFNIKPEGGIFQNFSL